MAYQDDIEHSFIQEMHILQERHTDFKERLKHVQWALEHNTVDFSSYYSCFYSWFIRDVNDNNDYLDETYDNEDIVWNNAITESNEVAYAIRRKDESWARSCTFIEWYAPTELDTLKEVISQFIA